jgi:hypothetical protein
MAETINGNFKKPSPLYIERSPDWNLIRTIKKGRRAVIDSNELMTPRLSGQSTQAYGKYKEWGALFNALGKTIEAWTGMLFRKQPQITNEIDAPVVTISRDGQPLNNTVQTITEEIVSLGWVGTLIDYPPTDQTLTKTQKKELNIQATAAMYPAESIINWDYAIINNVKQLNYVVLQEAMANSDDKFSHATKVVYRILDFDDEGYYRQTLVDKSGTVIDLIEPIRNGQRLNYIPFAFGTPNGVNGVLRTAVTELNRSHWISSVDHRQSLHWSGYNQMFIWGVPEDTEIEVGVPYANSNNEARAEIITGQASTPLKEELTAIENQMSIVGANALAAQGRYVQSAETATINQSSETSILSRMSQSISDYITWILIEIAKWEFQNEDLEDLIGYKLTSDFLSSAMAPEMISAQLGLYNAGKITLDTLINNLKAGEIIQENVENEEYKKQLEEQLQGITDRMEQLAINEVSEIING